MTDQKEWQEIQQALSGIETEEDVQEVRRMIEDLPADDPDRPDLAQQLATIASSLTMGGTQDG